MKLTPALIGIILGLVLFPTLISLGYIGILCWDRQQTVTVFEDTNVYDKWDYYSSPRPAPVDQVAKGTEWLVLRLHSGIDSVGILIKLSNGRLAYLAAFLSTDKIKLNPKLEPISLLLFLFSSGVVVWLLVHGGKNESRRLLLAAAMLPASVIVNFLLARGLL